MESYKNQIKILITCVSQFQYDMIPKYKSEIRNGRIPHRSRAPNSKSQIKISSTEPLSNALHEWKRSKHSNEENEKEIKKKSIKLYEEHCFVKKLITFLQFRSNKIK